MVLNSSLITLNLNIIKFKGQFFRSGHAVHPDNVSSPYHLNAVNYLEGIWVMKSGMWLPTFCSRPKNSYRDRSENYVCVTKAKLGSEGMEWTSTHRIFRLSQLALEKISVFWDVMLHKLIIHSNALAELAASLFTVYTVKPGSYVSEWTIESECSIKGMKICVAVEIK